MNNSLYTQAVDRTATQLAYSVNYYPWAALVPAAKSLVSWRRYFCIRKADFLQLLNEEKTKLLFNKREYQIVWEFNNIPTETEWNKKTPSYLLSVDLRFSPAIKGMAVAIISFYQH